MIQKSLRHVMDNYADCRTTAFQDEKLAIENSKGFLDGQSSAYACNGDNSEDSSKSIHQLHEVKSPNIENCEPASGLSQTAGTSKRKTRALPKWMSGLTFHSRNTCDTEKKTVFKKRKKADSVPEITDEEGEVSSPPLKVCVFNHIMSLSVCVLMCTESNEVYHKSSNAGAYNIV